MTGTAQAPARRQRLPWWRPRRSRWPQYVALAVVAITLVVGGVWLSRTYQRVIEYPDRPGVGSAEPIAVEVAKGASFPQVLAQLIEAGVIPEDEGLYFKLFVLHRGAAGKITAGAHGFRGDMTPEQVLAELVRPQRTEETRVTIPEGRNILEVADILAVAGYGDASVILEAMRDPALLKELSIEGESVEGYLYPDTYKFPTAATPQQVIRRMVEQHHKVYDNLKRSHREALEELRKTLGWGDREIVIMASLVEKETAAKHERPLIAGVFLNRLRFQSFQPKRLETDPTIIYGCTAAIKKSAACQQFEGRIRRIHLRDPDNPYNTYTHEGLPPGPITNAGKAAFEAVLAPKKSRFLYFVSRNDKTHQFSKTIAEHEAAVEKYMRQGAVGDGSAAGAADPGAE
ncbi:endolytic transglycosylase MltG [Nannocystis pusilla]|uniref:Endolytic murein transglycosylase n=1 Tax=Nannocystis pusilla TaxID=889268 RepID=A0ABS7TIB6_9BACT|nr:endolytic transglycosylase MltG [Nannocystis pusilla]MBZ5707959.1 endolytic transglycosylase MltG [Nannocystis pusilla]